jgi:molecular chaperone DnaK
MADSLIYTAEKSIKDAGDKVDTNLKSDVEEKIKTLKDVKDTDNAEEIKTQTEALSTSLQELGKKMYEQAAKEQPKEEAKDETKEDEKKDAEEPKEETK